MKTLTPRGILLFLILLTWAGSLCAAVVIERIRPDKMIYPPNAPAVLKVDLKNTAESADAVMVVFELLSELDNKEEIARQAVTLAPKGSTTISLAWNTGPRDYGHGALVSVRDKSGGKVLDKKEEPFSITDNLWKVARANLASHWCVIPKTFDDSSNGPLVKSMRASFEDHSYYANYYEFCGWAPDDLFELCPKATRRRSGARVLTVL